MHRPQDAFTREAGLLGHTLRRQVQQIGPKLEPRAAELVERPAGDEVQGARRQAAAARLATHPVADLSVSLVTDPAEAHAAEDAPCLRLGHGEGSRSAVVPPRRRLVDPRLSLGLAVGLRDCVQPAGDLLVAVDTLDQRGNVSLGPGSELHDAIVERRVRHGEHAAEASSGKRRRRRQLRERQRQRNLGKRWHRHVRKRNRRKLNQRKGKLGGRTLVDREGRIGPLNTVFYDTLLDENAASHIALGSAYESAVDESDTDRLNRSSIHVDFMIGSPEVDVTGITRDGERVPVLRDSSWQL